MNSVLLRYWNVTSGDRSSPVNSLRHCEPLALAAVDTSHARSPVLTGCTAAVPDDLARTVLLEELPREEGIAREGFLACVAVDSQDANANLLAALQDAHIEAVPASQCQWENTGSYHRTSKRKAMLVNVYGYKTAGTVWMATAEKSRTRETRA